MAPYRESADAHNWLEEVSGRTYKCLDCGAVGKFSELIATDCPNGKEPYPKDFPHYLDITKEQRSLFTVVRRIYRLSDYEDKEFEQVLSLAEDRRRFDALRKLGAFSSRIVEIAVSNIDESYVSDLKSPITDMIVAHGIVPQAIDKLHHVSSIGFSESAQAWYGWSHRAIAGYAVGAKSYPDDFGRKCNSLEDCKASAITFVMSVA